MTDLPDLPWEAFDPDHVDHDDWVRDTGRCFSPDCPRHPKGDRDDDPPVPAR